jgi:homoserine kinase
MVKIRIPATTANMGPGFDCFGMALDLYNEVEIYQIDNGVETILNGQTYNISKEDNLIYTGLTKAFDRCGYEYKGFRINIYRCDIPISRGLGSSAACIVAGIMAANHIMKDRLSLKDIIDIATEIEGHPDNVVPAIVGGMVVSMQDQSEVVYSKVNMPKDLKFAVMVPEFKVSTHEARGVLPKSYGKEDCIFNISRAGMLISILNNGEVGKLRACLDDKVHQPYRKSLIKNIDGIFNKAKELGSLGEFISGSGSTLIAVIEGSNETFINGMEKYLSSIEGGWRVFLLSPEHEGAKIIA